MKASIGAPMRAPELTTLNIMLVVVGLTVLAVGLYRIFPLQMGKRFWVMNGPLVFLLAVGIFIVMHSGSPGAGIKTWFKTSGVLGGSFLPLMVLLTLVMGIGAVVTKLHEKSIQDFILRHPVSGTLVATFLTPTVNTLVSPVESLWKLPEMKPMLLYYLLMSAQVSIPLFMLRQMGFSASTDIPAKMYISGFVISLLVLPFMRPIFWMVEKVCETSGALWGSLVGHTQTALAVILVIWRS